jgi:hypothetical protein
MLWVAAVANLISDLSWIEMTKLIPTLLMHFDIDLAHPEDEPEQHCWLVHKIYFEVLDHGWI